MQSLSRHHQVLASRVGLLGLTVVLAPSLLLASEPQAMAAISSPVGHEASAAVRGPLLLAQEAIVETMLAFETQSISVRIYRRGEDLFMNLYDKQEDIVFVNGAPAEIVPSSRDQTVYKNSVGEDERFASINVLNETELKIVAADGTVVLQESGYNTVVGVPAGETDFQGNNFAPGTPALVLAPRYANIRQNPRVDSSIINVAPRRDVVEVIDRVGNPEDGFIWYQVLYDDSTGWIRGDLLAPT